MPSKQYCGIYEAEKQSKSLKLSSNALRKCFKSSLNPCLVCDETFGKAKEALLHMDISGHLPEMNVNQPPSESVCITLT